MKKCPNCNGIFNDSMDVCPNCNQPLENQPKIIAFFEEYNKAIISCALIAAFLLGCGFKSCTGITRSDYNDLLSQNQTLTTEKETISNEYSAYKTKMQPYETQQEADVKAAETKKAAEEQVKKEEEEKAAAERAKKEAEEKAVKEAQKKKEAEEQAATARAYSFGMSQIEFYNSFNGTATNNGFNVFLGKESTNGNIKSYMTLNSDVTVETYAQSGFLQTVSVIAKRTSADSLTNAAYYALTAIMVIDPSLSVNAIDSMMADLVDNASNNGGMDYSTTKNGIKYTANVDNSSIMFYFAKER